ncbi:hypothetical protein DS745_19410 [Anaerobacillus alkaliphilus]|uniref:Uncharacterized protein n=1 Tax=Anaerobacillus alkaliphilus TaxID=1548597 RepID=A0A4Q0VQ01_9BACI|nr:hypothetical protein [Anaerobacillus alkaliphilus]RXI98493.1 hypothetical protein DS745_19410 [Anaerobacillus alkaliphilus]
MFKVSNISSLKQVDYCVWHVVFNIENLPLEYATDFLYLIKEQKWVVNSLITHELTSLMKGHTCKYCGETKIACFVASHDFKMIKQGIAGHEYFRARVSEELQIDKNIATELMVVNKKSEWEKLASENRFYGNLQRIKERQNE